MFLEKHADQESAEQNSTAAAQSDEEESDEGTPPPLPQRRRLEATPSDEPETKRGRPSVNGMSQTTASTRKKDKQKKKSMMKHLSQLMPRKRKAKADRQSHRGRLGRCSVYCFTVFLA